MTSTGPMLARRHGGGVAPTAAPGSAGRGRGLGEGPIAPQAWPTAPFGARRPRDIPRQEAEPRGTRGSVSIADIAGGSGQFHSGGVPRPVGPIRPVDQAGPDTGLTVPLPAGFRPLGDLSERPTPAGIHDALLGGTAHRRVDRRAALAILLEWPDAPAAARVTKDFLVRAVRFAARNGVSQFLVLGSGALTIDPVHEIACAVAPESQTVYVEPDPLVIARVLPDIPAGKVAMVQANPARPHEVLSHPCVRAHLDVTRPIAVVAVPGLAQVADDEDPSGVLRAYRDVTPRGSLLVFSQLCDEGSARGLRGLFEQAGIAGSPRPHAQTVEMVSTWEPIEPGLVPADEWHAPDERDHPHVGRLPVYASVGWH